MTKQVGWAYHRDHIPIPLMIPWATGRFYTSPLHMDTTTGVATAGFLRSIPIYVPNPAGVIATSIGIEITVAGAAGALARLGICDCTDDFRPGKLLLDAGTVTIDAVGFRSIIINLFLRQGWYWLIWINDVAATVRCNRYVYMFETIGDGSPMSIIVYPGNSYLAGYADMSVSGLPGYFPIGNANSVYTTLYLRVMLGV